MKFVWYYRVSTQSQGSSWLGLEAQKSIVNQYVNGWWWTLLREFIEIESWKSNNRPELEMAFEICKKEKAKLIIAKLDRLSRNLNFITNLMESKLEFIALDLPNADHFSIHILAAVAQKEREQISERTINALKARKARGLPLWTPSNLTNEARAKGRLVQHLNSLNVCKQAKALIEEYKLKWMSFNSIANKLNELGFVSPKWKNFKSMTVLRLYKTII